MREGHSSGVGSRKLLPRIEKGDDVRRSVMVWDSLSTNVTTAEKGKKYDSLMPLLEAMFREFQDAAKEKPDGVLNKRKVEIVNRLLRDILSILEGEVTRDYLDLLDENDMPQNGDVVLIIGQAVAAMHAFKDKYYGYISRISAQTWATSETTGIEQK
jgi:hypothetical protein